MQQDTPDDFVIATGKGHTVREFVEASFAHVNISIEWSGSGVHEVGKNAATGDVLVRIDPRYFRPTEVELLCGDATKAKNILGWEPTVTFHELVKIMMDADIKDLQPCPSIQLPLSESATQDARNNKISPLAHPDTLMHVYNVALTCAHPEPVEGLAQLKEQVREKL